MCSTNRGVYCDVTFIRKMYWVLEYIDTDSPLLFFLLYNKLVVYFSISMFILFPVSYFLLAA